MSGSVDIATLAIAVDSTQARVAALELDKLGNAGAGAEKKVGALAKATDELKANWLAMAAVVLAAAAAFEKYSASIKHGIEAMALTKDLGQQAGTTAEGISKFEESARTSGTTLEEVAHAMFMMNKSVTAMKDPLSDAAQAYRAIGLSAKDFQGLKPDEQFTLVAKALDKYAEGMDKNAIKQVILGRGGYAMGKMLHDVAEAGTLVATVTNQQADAADHLGDRIDTLKLRWEQHQRALASELLPTVENAIDALEDLLKHFGSTGSNAAIFREILIGIAGAIGSMSLAMSDIIDGMGAWMAKLAALKENGGYAIWKRIDADREANYAKNEAAFEKLWANLRKTSEATEEATKPKPNAKFDTFAAKQAQDYKSYTEAIESATRAAQYELDTSTKQTAAETSLADIRAGRGEMVKKLTLAQQNSLEIMLQEQIRIEGLVKARQDEAVAMEAVRKLLEEETNRRMAARDSVDAFRTSTAQELEDYKFGLELLGRSAEEQRA